MANANKTLAYPAQTIFHQLALGLAWRPRGFTMGPLGFALGLRGFLDYTNMLVLATQTQTLGALPNVKPQLKWLCVLIEYRLKDRQL